MATFVDSSRRGTGVSEGRDSQFPAGFELEPLTCRLMLKGGTWREGLGGWKVGGLSPSHVISPQTERGAEPETRREGRPLWMARGSQARNWPVRGPESGWQGHGQHAMVLAFPRDWRGVSKGPEPLDLQRKPGEVSLGRRQAQGPGTTQNVPAWDPEGVQESQRGANGASPPPAAGIPGSLPLRGPSHHLTQHHPPRAGTHPSEGIGVPSLLGARGGELRVRV